MRVVLALFVAGMAGYRAYEVWKAKPTDLKSWSVFGAWVASALFAITLSV